MSLRNGGGSIVGTIAVGTSLSTGDFGLAGGFAGTDVIGIQSVFGTHASGVSLLTNPTTITATGLVTNSANSAAAVKGLGATAWTLTNLGIISENGSVETIGISLTARGTIINAGGVSVNVNSDTSTTGISAGGQRRHPDQSCSVRRHPSYDAIRATGGAATIVNSGGIGGNSGSPSGTGVLLAAGGSVTNPRRTARSAAAIAVSSSPARRPRSRTPGHVTGSMAGYDGYGVLLWSGGTVTNISGAMIGGYIAVAANAQATVTNAGASPEIRTPEEVSASVSTSAALSPTKAAAGSSPPRTASR